MQQLAIFKDGKPFANVPCDKDYYLSPIYNVTALPYEVKQKIWNFIGGQSADTKHGGRGWDVGEWSWEWKTPSVHRKA
jgi:hypothetical protein